MLVSLKEILGIAQAKKCAVGSFNTTGLECIEAVIGAAEEKNQPVIIMHAQVHEEMKLTSLDVIGRVMVMMADRAKVPVCVHLDHGTDLTYLKQALDLGFTSIMYDGSNLPYELNLANTRVAVEMAARYGAGVEAEIGSMGAREEAIENPENHYTDPDAAKLFAQESGIDALACAFGTVHGIYLTEPRLDFERLGKIASLVDIPLVMHGGSGVCDSDYRRVISLGIRKINYYTYMAKAGATAVREAANQTFFHDMAVTAALAMRKNALQALTVFGGEN